MKTDLFLYTLQLADNALILGQRNSEWTGHGPVLEQDIAITNIALDLLGQARNYYQYTALLYNGFNEQEKEEVDAWIPRLWKSYGRELQEDDLAFLREERQFLNVLLTELPKGDWSYTVLRQFFFSAYQFLFYQQMQQSKDHTLAAIAEKSIKEVAYHLRWSGEWVIRLGDGTEESNERIRASLAALWPYTGELFEAADYEIKMTIQDAWLKKIDEVFAEATLELPKSGWMQKGGKQGQHTEHMGYLLAEMQFMQRTYPNMVW